MRKEITQASVIAVVVLLVTFFAGPAAAAIGKNVVDSAWKRIATAAGIEPIPITYEADKAPNAWVKFQSSNKFSVHVTQGLMQVLNSPDEIAGILGHEIGHVKLGHYNKGVQRNIGWSVVGAVLGKAGGLAEVAGAVGMNLAESGFSREQEVEADDYGADLAIQAGYSPWGLYNAMKSFRDNGFKTEPSGFNSHPPTDRRLQRLEERARRAEAAQPAKTK
jgi:putative metalloprotease